MLPSDAANVQIKLWADSWVTFDISDLFILLLTLLSLELLFASLICPLHAPFFSSSQEGRDYYHFRKVKGQWGFSSGRLISWPWHSLSTAFSLLQNWRDLQAIKEHEWGSVLWWFFFTKGNGVKMGELLTNPGYSLLNKKKKYFVNTNCVWLIAFQEWENVP